MKIFSAWTDLRPKTKQIIIICISIVLVTLIICATITDDLGSLINIIGKKA